jgi:hypothetical protein
MYWAQLTANSGRCRAVRFVLFGFFAASASVGALIATTQLIASLNKAPNALPQMDVLQSLGIDVGAAALFLFLLRRDLQVVIKCAVYDTKKGPSG